MSHDHDPGSGRHHEHDHPDHPDHDDHHDHEHGHDHDDHGHGHGAGRRWWRRLGHAATPHSHDSTGKVDRALESSRQGMRALWISLALLGLTAALQAIVVAVSGSVALLGDTLHNVADALTAIPLGIAFLVGRRVANRRYTYGYGRAEDLAGIVIVGFITASAVLAAYEAIGELRHPTGVSHLPVVAIAGLIGFLGNEAVARYRISVGQRIGSAALVADGLHARTDGFTSLAVLLSAGGVAVGWWWADPVVGLGITVAILVVLKDAAREVYRRLMDAVDPELVTQAEGTLRDTPGVLSTGAVRVRWIGHQLHAECEIVLDPSLTLTQAHAIAVDAEHRLLHAIPRLSTAMVHTDPGGDGDHHEPLADHR